MTERLNASDADGGPVSERLRDLLDHVLFYGGLLMAATGIVGEVLGWWGDLGLVFTIGGFLAGLVSVADVNGRRLLAVTRSLPGSVDALHNKHDAMLEKQDDTLGHLVRIGDILDERLPRGQQ